MALGLASGVLPSHSAVTAYLSAGTTCGGPSTANFVAGGSAIDVSLCVSATVESLCNVSYRFLAGSGEGGRFNVTSRTLGSTFSFSNLSTFAVPFAVSNPASSAVNTTDFGSGTSDGLPVTALSDRLVSTITLQPQASATASDYVITLDPALAVVGVDQDGACGGVSNPPVDTTIAATFTLVQSAPPLFTSAPAATFTVNFSGTHQVAASGNPAPTLSISGSPPSGVTFNSGNAQLSGTPALGTVGSYPLTFTAANGTLPNATQSFTLIIQKANQAINFNPLADRAFDATNPFPVSASSSLGMTYPVTFSSSTLSVCTVSGANVTMLTAGTCTIVASQAGDANYNAASVARSFQIGAVAPSAPTIGTAVAGDASVSVAFTAPGFTGGAPLTSFAATCGGQSATGSMSPMVVAGLPNGVAVTCTVTAFNGTATSAPSAPSNSVTPLAAFTVTPSAGANGSISPAMAVTVTQGNTAQFTVTPNSGFVASVGGSCGGALVGTTYTTNAITAHCSVSATFAPALTFVRALSRKTHGAAGERNIELLANEPISGNVTTEPRAVQNGGHLIVFEFDATVTSVGSVNVSDAAAMPITPVSVSFVDKEVRVVLPTLPDGSRASVTVNNVNGAVSATASLGVLFGDVTDSRRVSAADIAAVKALGTVNTNDTNRRADVNLNGQISAQDVNALKGRSGMALQ
jgi:hypothetical protein